MLSITSQQEHRKDTEQSKNSIPIDPRLLDGQISKPEDKTNGHTTTIPKPEHQFLRPCWQVGKCDGCKWLEVECDMELEEVCQRQSYRVHDGLSSD